jgi:hypothetical protein
MSAGRGVTWFLHRNSMFRSVNGGAQRDGMWAPVANSGPVVAAHPGDAGTAWFAPAQPDRSGVPVDGRAVVNRSRGGGKRFQPCQRAFPAKLLMILFTVRGSLWTKAAQISSWNRPAAASGSRSTVAII